MGGGEVREIKIGDKVFRSIDPEYTTNYECAIECTIVSLKIEKYIDPNDKIVEEIKECEVSYGSFDENSWIAADKIFYTKKEAIDSIRGKLEEKIEKLEVRINKYREIIGNIHEK